MFRRKEESFEFESDGADENAISAAAGMGNETASGASEESSRPAAPSVAAAPRPASLAQAPGAAPRMPASTSPSAPAGFRSSSAPAAPVSAPSSSASVSASAPVPPVAARPAAPSAAPSSSAGGYSASSAGSSSSGNAKTGGKRILTVGNDILLKGEIATCDRLVIEGEVDAKLNDVHTVEIAETGSFRGKAEIEDAEISGLFEGDLVVRNRLTIYSTGKVRGNITFGEIEIERGGELTGTIAIVGQTQGKSKEKAA